MAYEKVQPEDVEYDYVEMLKRMGRQVCDSRDHNEPTGCSNPDCFKWNKIPAAPA